MKYNLKLVDWKDDDADKIVKRAEKLSATKEDDITFKDIAVPVDSDSNTSDPYNASIIVWKEPEKFAVMMLLGYDCGDEIFSEVRRCPYDSEKLKAIINEMYQKYHDEEKLEKMISTKMFIRDENMSEKEG